MPAISSTAMSRSVVSGERSVRQAARTPSHAIMPAAASR